MVDSPGENLAQLGRVVLAQLCVMFFLKTPPLEFPFFAVRWSLHLLVWRRAATHSVGRVGAKPQPWSTGHVVQWVDTKSWTRGVGVRGGGWRPRSGHCRSIVRAGPLLGI